MPLTSWGALSTFAWLREYKAARRDHGKVLSLHGSVEADPLINCGLSFPQKQKQKRQAMSFTFISLTHPTILLLNCKALVHILLADNGEFGFFKRMGWCLFLLSVRHFNCMHLLPWQSVLTKPVSRKKAHFPRLHKICVKWPQAEDKINQAGLNHAKQKYNFYFLNRGPVCSFRQWNQINHLLPFFAKSLFKNSWAQLKRTN